MASKSSPKMDVRSAWSAWASDGSPDSGSEFLERVASWTEGTAAQLARAPWRTGARRPTTAEIEDRLRHHLGLVAHGGQGTYLEALELARRGVIEELQRAERAGS